MAEGLSHLALDICKWTVSKQETHTPSALLSASTHPNHMHTPTAHALVRRTRTHAPTLLHAQMHERSCARPCPPAHLHTAPQQGQRQRRFEVLALWPTPPQHRPAAHAARRAPPYPARTRNWAKAAGSRAGSTRTPNCCLGAAALSPARTVHSTLGEQVGGPVYHMRRVTHPCVPDMERRQ